MRDFAVILRKIVLLAVVGYVVVMMCFVINTKYFPTVNSGLHVDEMNPVELKLNRIDFDTSIDQYMLDDFFID